MYCLDPNLEGAPVARGRGSHPLNALGTEQGALPTQQPMSPVSVCPLSPPHCPGNKCRPWGSNLSQEEEEEDTRESQLLASGSHS